jgi:hypothetical protein
VEPIFHGISQFLDRNVVSDFQDTIAQRQGVIVYAGIGEIAHAEAVKPLQGASMPLPLMLVLDPDLASKHEAIKSQ